MMTKLKMELEPSPLTPSGIGTESWKIQETKGCPNPRYKVTFKNGDMIVEIMMDGPTLYFFALEASRLAG